MAPIKDPITGIALNPIIIERKSLSYRDAVTAWVLRLRGVKYNHVAQYLGANTHRLGEVFRGEVHIGSEAEAKKLMG